MKIVKLQIYEIYVLFCINLNKFEDLAISKIPKTKQDQCIIGIVKSNPIAIANLNRLSIKVSLILSNIAKDELINQIIRIILGKTKIISLKTKYSENTIPG